jgi:hypothetical protein
MPFFAIGSGIPRTRQQRHFYAWLCASSTAFLMLIILLIIFLS